MAGLAKDVYGNAFFEIAIESGKILELEKEVKGLQSIWHQNDEFVNFLTSPVITKEKKWEMILELFDKKISDETMGLLKIVINKGRERDIPDIFNVFISRIKEYRGIGDVYITSAIPLSKMQQKKIEEKVLKTSKYNEIEPHYEIDENVIGGVKIRVGDKVLDGTVKTQIDNIAKKLHAI